MSEMNVSYVTAEDIRKMTDIEGLVLQGCGGDAAEWADGINNLLTAASILLDGDTFKDAFVFEHEGHTNILFDMENVKLDITKLAIWRLQSYRIYGAHGFRTTFLLALAFMCQMFRQCPQNRR